MITNTTLLKTFESKHRSASVEPPTDKINDSGADNCELNKVIELDIGWAIFKQLSLCHVTTLMIH